MVQRIASILLIAVAAFTGGGCGGVSRRPALGDAPDDLFLEEMQKGLLGMAQLSGIAEERGHDARVRRLARKAQAEMARLERELRSVAPATEAMLPGELDEEQAGVIERIARMEGRRLDQTYLACLIGDLEGLIEGLQARESPPTASEVATFASRELPVLEDLLRRAQELQESVGLPPAAPAVPRPVPALPGGRSAMG